jgi:hypothetical protein
LQGRGTRTRPPRAGSELLIRLSKRERSGMRPPCRMPPPTATGTLAAVSFGSSALEVDGFRPFFAAKGQLASLVQLIMLDWQQFGKALVMFLHVPVALVRSRTSHANTRTCSRHKASKYEILIASASNRCHPKT